MWKAWQNAISKTEKVVNSSSSFISIRYLSSDDIASMLTPFRKLIGSTHPITKTARSIIDRDKGVGQIRGLMLLLLSKSFNKPIVSLNNNQKSLSEILETAYAALNIHSGIIDTNVDNQTKEWIDNMKLGNKMATLIGDYLLAAVSRALADLKNTEIVNNVSKGIGDTVISSFESKSWNDSSRYKELSYLSSGSLFSECCRSSVFIKSDANEYSTSGLNEIKELSRNWSIKWSELYTISSDINTLIQSLSNGQITSSIFQHNSNTNADVDLKSESSSTLKKAVELLDQIYSEMISKQKDVELLSVDSNSTELLHEITHILYQDAKMTSSHFLKTV